MHAGAQIGGQDRGHCGGRSGAGMGGGKGTGVGAVQTGGYGIVGDVAHEGIPQGEEQGYMEL